MIKETILNQLNHLGIQVTVGDDRIRLEPGSKVPAELVEEIRWLKPKILRALTLSRRVSAWAGNDPKKWRRVHKEVLHIFNTPSGRLGPREVLVTWVATCLGKTQAQQELTRLRQRPLQNLRQRNAVGGRHADISFWRRLVTRQEPLLPIALAEDAQVQNVFIRIIDEESKDH